MPKVETQTERTFQNEVVHLARMCNWTCFHFHDSRRQVRPGVFIGDSMAAGFPDLVLVRERVVFIECKTVKGKVTDRQAHVHEILRKAGAEVHVFRPTDWDDIKQVLARRKP